MALRVRTITEILERKYPHCETCWERQAQAPLDRSYTSLVPIGDRKRISGKYEDTWQYYQCSNCKDLWLCEWDNTPDRRERSLFRIQCSWD